MSHDIGWAMVRSNLHSELKTYLPFVVRELGRKGLTTRLALVRLDELVKE